MKLVGALVLVVAAGCSVTPPRAVVTQPTSPAGAPLHTLLALPTVCVTEQLDATRCQPRSYVANSDGSAGRPMPLTFGELIDPLLRLKLELSGFTLADGETLRLETAERTERSDVTSTGADANEASSTTTNEGDVRTVLSLAPAEQQAAAGSLGLQGVVQPKLHVRPAPQNRIALELTLELRALPKGALVLSVRCVELLESPDETAGILASCVGDGVLAVRAPDALLGKPL